MSNYLTNIYQTLRDHTKYFPVSAILEDTGHCQNMSIVDTGRFWEILVIPVLQILENSGKYW
jgi:hypothetical protein